MNNEITTQSYPRGLKEEMVHEMCTESNGGDGGIRHANLDNVNIHSRQGRRQ